jgi:uncharacterized membrane protein
MNTSGDTVGVASIERPGKRRVAILAILALFFAMLTTLNVVGAPQTSLAAPICTPGSIYVNTGVVPMTLKQYSPTGELLDSVPTARGYTDIAFSSDGLTLYGIMPGTANILYTIDPKTGAETASLAVTGLPASDYYVNALSALADGSLLVGAARSGGATAQQIFRVNPSTGVATLFPASFPAGFGSAGDFLSLADGDVLAVGAGASGNSLFRIAPSFAVTRVGAVPESFGAAQSGGKIYLAGSTGNIYEIANVPTSPSTAPVPITTVATTGLPFYGATSQQDSGLCSELTIAKSSDPASGTPIALGQTVTYTITLSNANGTAPAEVDHTDDLTGVLDDATLTSLPVVSSGTPLTIDPVVSDGFRISGVIPVGGQTTITYAVTVNNPTTGDRQLANYVVPTGTAPPATCDPGDSACTTHPISDLSLVKSIDPIDEADYVLDQVLTYSFVVTNTGKTTLTNVTVIEGAFTGSGDLSAITPASVASLAPGASTTFTATYVLTQADIDRGETTNTATATAVPPVGPPIVTPPSTVEIPAIPAPALSVVKSADRLTVAAPGDAVTYSFLVTNTGNVTMTDVAVNEEAFDGDGALGPVSPASVASLLPGQSVTFTAAYTTTQADIDRGSTTNTATATGNPPTGPPTVSPPSTVVVTSEQAPALTMVKSVDLDDQASYVVGQTVTYSFLVTNSGNTTVTDVTIEEMAFNGSGALGPLAPVAVASLAPGQSTTFTATYQLTQADVDRGNTSNTAVATADPPTGPPIESPPSTVEIPTIPAPGLSLIKSVDPSDEASYVVGQTVTYSFLATNTGNTTLTNVVIVEGAFDGSGDLSAIAPASVPTLLPGESATFTATYELTQADIDRGSTTNTATATGVPPTGPPIESPPSTVELPSIPAPSLTVVKSVDLLDDSSYVVGQTVTYSFLVRNTGNTTLADVAVVERAFDGSGELGDITPAAVAALLPGETATFTATYELTQADVDRGSTTNTATATGVPPTGPPVDSPPSSVEIPSAPSPAMSLLKSVDPSGEADYVVGQELTYSFLVTNTGNTTLTDVAVVEGAFSGSGALSPITPSSVASLIPGDSATFTATYVLTQADIDRGSTSNTATATAVPPTGPPIDSPPSTVEIPSIPAPGLSLVKSVDRTTVTTVGQTLTYSFLVTNTGNTTLTDVTVTEGAFNGSGDLSAIAPASVASLIPGASAIFTASYAVTRADLDAGTLRNTATAAGVPPTGPSVDSPPSTVEITAIPPSGGRLAITGSQPFWAALLAAAFLVVIGGAFKIRSGSRWARR